MRRRACIVGEPTGWHASRLSDLLERRGLAASIVRWQDVTASVATGGPAIGPPALADADVVAVRGMPGAGGAEARLEEVIFRMDALARVAAVGTPVVNPPRALEIAIDKYLSLVQLAAAGIPVPRTQVVQGVEAARRAWHDLGEDCVAKPLFGSRGRGLLRLTSAPRADEFQPGGGGVIYLQEFVPHDGWDARVFVVGDRLFAMRRSAAAGEWRTNIALGGRPEPIDLPDSWGDLALRAAAAVAASVAGVDLLPAADGRVLVLEVNAVPGWRGLETVCGPAVGLAVAEHLANLAGT